jgi:hypothetical protein
MPSSPMKICDSSPCDDSEEICDSSPCDDSEDIYGGFCGCQNQLAHVDWNGNPREDLPDSCKRTMGILITFGSDDINPDVPAAEVSGE